MKLIVEMRDIINGQASSCGNCPIALAIKRQFPESKEISVRNFTVEVDEKVFWLPYEACRFIRHFDAGWLVDPQEFELKID